MRCVAKLVNVSYLVLKNVENKLQMRSVSIVEFLSMLFTVTLLCSGKKNVCRNTASLYYPTNRPAFSSVDKTKLSTG